MEERKEKKTKKGGIHGPDFLLPGGGKHWTHGVESAGREGKDREATEEAEHCAGSGWWPAAKRETEEVTG